MKHSRLLLLLLFIFAISLAPALSQDNQGDERYVGEVVAPSIPDVDWINVETPLTFEGLRGKIVLLDFWTYGCINCIHMIPILRDLEERFAEELVVIGVHSGKFEGEQVTDNLQQIVQRYDIHHPVINDENFLVWRSFGVNAWPTFVVIDPNGNVVAAQPGEVPYEAFEIFLSSMIEYYDNNPELGEINRTPLEFALEGAGDPGTALAFPGKVLADTNSNRLFIADTNHHRIVIADLTSYEVLEIIGTGERGYSDGDFDGVTFDQPQGMALVGNVLYVADVNNHAVRAVNLETQSVTTVAGSGRKGTTFASYETIITDTTNFDLRSPWDLAYDGGNILYIAMAGAHQIWQLDLDRNELRAIVGNAYESQLSTTLSQSELAQPSGLHWVDGRLYFADSESSTVRVAFMNENRVSVISGTTENNLFDYGDIDGIVGESRLQHPLGVTGNDDGSLIYLADTYNNKIKVYSHDDDVTTTLFGLGGTGGYRDGDVSVAQFDEPGGLDYANGMLYVADTNNHVIRLIDLDAKIVSTLQFPNPEALVIERDEPTILGGNSADGVRIALDPQTVTTGEVELQLNFDLPEGYKINELTDSTVNITSDSNVLSDDTMRVVITETNTSIPLILDAGETTLSLTIALFYCEDDSYCLIDDVQIDVPLTVTTDADSEIITVNRAVQLPDILTGDA